MKQKGFFLLALVFGLIAAGSAYMYLSKISHAAPMETRTLVIAKTNIPARSIIDAANLMTMEIPAQGYPQGGASSIESVKGTVALVTLTPGDPVLKPMLAPTENPPAVFTSSATGRRYAVPKDKRAVAVPINLVSGVGYAVKPGDYVDVLVSMDAKDSSGTLRSVTSLAAQDVLVLSAGETVSSDQNKVEAKSYTLALTVPQAMAVTMGSEKGAIRLLLRNPANSELRSDSPINDNIFFEPDYFTRYK